MDKEIKRTTGIRLKRKKTTRMLYWIVSLAAMLFLLVPACPKIVRADNSEQKTVRVGYVNVATYEEGGEGEYKRGSGYEYLQRISYLTGWKYEYVYGSFKDCYEMLVNGEIDLFGDVSYKPERAELFHFASYPQGKDTYLLYTSKDRTDLTEGDISKLNGSKIGVTAGSYQEGLLKEWLENNRIQADIVEYDGYETLMAALDAGKLDAIATPDLATSYGYVAIINIGFSEYYFAVSKSRPDLLTELNEALYEIQSSEMDYNNQLASRYHNRMTNGLLLNEKEKEWLAQKDNTIRLGYIRDNLPYCGESDGTLVGIMKTIVDTLEEEFHIKVETVSYENRELLRQALADGQIDIGGPVLSDFYLAEQEDGVLTNSMIETTPVVIYNGDDAEGSLDVIAVTDSSIFEQEVVKVLFPESEIYPCSSQSECLKAVAEGKAGSTLAASARLNILLSDSTMKKLSFAEMADKVEICLMASKENRRAASILNKGIQMASDVINGLVLVQNSGADREISLMEFISEYAILLISVALLIIITLGVLLYRLSVSRKKLTAALTEAQSANIAKTTFLSNMSHDIRTPMNAIIGFTNIATKQNPKPQVLSCLEKISDSSDHLLTLINDVLDISYIESGKIKYRPTPVDITTVTDTVLDIANGFLANRVLTFHVHRNDPEHPYVLADAVRIREILVNIISNAVKFTEDGGSILFETGSRNGTQTKQIVLCYRIADTGIGMSEEFVKHIFDEFAQEEASARTQYKGTGLGMAITRKYVQLMGGSISVKSKKGEGSEFLVEIPVMLTDQDQIQKKMDSIMQSDLSGVKALMAEDNDLNAEIATIQLEEYGIEVTRACDGKEAVKIFEEHPADTFDVILMDIMMPEMNGYEATKAIRTMKGRPDGQQIPIIAMTANAFAEDVQASLDAGMNSHLSKPIVMEEVVKTIQANLRRR